MKIHSSFRIHNSSFLYAIALCVLAFLPSRSFPQSNQLPRGGTQIWSDVQVSHSLRQNTDLLLGGSLRLGRGASHFVYERVGAGLSFKLSKHFILSPLYSYFARQPDAGQDSRENRLALEATASVALRRWIITDRNFIERRFRDPRDSSRYHNRVQLERQINLASAPWRVFASDEVYYDWSFNAWVRNRFSIGGGKSLNEKVSVDVYYLRQNDGHIRPGDLHAFGIAMRIRL